MMKTKILVQTVIAAASMCMGMMQAGFAENRLESVAQTAGKSANSKELRADLVSFYEIPLVCPAAPQIGCGSASKPLLLGLEAGRVASEAWLNRAGTTLAVVWSEQSTPSQRSEALKSILDQSQIEAKELSGKAKQRALVAFRQRSGWYRGAEVDRLSEEEAGVIATRLVHRIRTKITVSDEKAQTIEQAFTGVLRQKLTGKMTKSDAQEAMINICREKLSEKDVAILQEAFAAGVCPLKDEK